MGLLKSIVEQLQARSGVTPVTPVTRDGVTAKPNTGAACTPVTPVTPVSNNTGVAISGFTLRMVSLPIVARPNYGPYRTCFQIKAQRCTLKPAPP